jgi:uncharacterized membrane protein
MSDLTQQQGWWAVVARRTRERDVRRQLLHNDIRKAVKRQLNVARHLEGRVPAAAAEFLKLIGGALLGFWLIARLLSLLGVNPVYTLVTFGLVYSLQSTYHKHMLSKDASFEIPRCACAGGSSDESEAVLRSRHSTLWGIPNSVLGALLYCAIPGLMAAGQVGVAGVLAVGALAFSAYLSYVMVFRLGSLCTNCINVAALNALLVLQLVLAL